jgi:hydroxymethylbilane synthase
MSPVRIGTRSSPLALWQAKHVAEQLRTHTSRPIEFIHVQTEGDRDQAASLAHIGGRGVFTKEIQRAVLDGRVHVAVHSLKDLPTGAVPGLVLAAVPPRGPIGDVLVTSTPTRFDDLPRGATVATGSLRRRAQLLNRRPDLCLADIRGNIDTRLRKFREHGYHALVLAQAGLERLGLTEVITEVLDPDWMLPAVGQGALGLECRSDDDETRQLLARFEDANTRRAVEAERSLLFHLGVGCQVPLGAVGRVVGLRVELRAAVLAQDGSRRIVGDVAGPAQRAEELGRELAERLRREGADEFLGSSRS